MNVRSNVIEVMVKNNLLHWFFKINIIVLSRKFLSPGLKTMCSFDESDPAMYCGSVFGMSQCKVLIFDNKYGTTTYRELCEKDMAGIYIYISMCVWETERACKYGEHIFGNPHQYK